MVHPTIVQQVDQLTEYFKNDFNIDKTATLEQIVTIIKGIHIELISKPVAYFGGVSSMSEHSPTLKKKNS